MTASSDAADAFYRHVMGDVYRSVPQGPGLTPIEEAALEPLRLAWADLVPEEVHRDRHWGATTDRTDPDAWQIQPLTLARLDTFAARVWADQRDHDGAWSVKPDTDAERDRWAAEDRSGNEAKQQARDNSGWD